MFNTQTLINETIEKQSQYKSGQRDGAKFHISDAGNCYRMRIYKRLGIEPTRKIEIEGLRKMMAGEAGHEKLQSLLRKKLFLSECEVGDENIVGHPDGVIKNGELILLEIKTTEKFQIGYIKKQGAKKEHELQMKTYWKYLRAVLPDLNHAVISYVKREDFQALDYYYLWDNKTALEVNAEWQPLLQYWNNKSLPPCTCKEMWNGAGPKYCRYGIDETNCCSESLWKGGGSK